MCKRKDTTTSSLYVQIICRRIFMRLVGALVSRKRGGGRRMGKLDTFRDYLDFYFLFIFPCPSVKSDSFLRTCSLLWTPEEPLSPSILLFQPLPFENGKEQKILLFSKKHKGKGETAIWLLIVKSD